MIERLKYDYYVALVVFLFFFLNPLLGFEHLYPPQLQRKCFFLFLLFLPLPNINQHPLGNEEGKDAYICSSFKFRSIGDRNKTKRHKITTPPPPKKNIWEEKEK